jgi:hypothetical protein
MGYTGIKTSIRLNFIKNFFYAQVYINLPLKGKKKLNEERQGGAQ